MEKKCYNCKIVKPISEFNKKKTEKDGYQRICRDCQRIYRKEYHNRPEVLEKAKKYRKLQYQKEKRLKNEDSFEMMKEMIRIRVKRSLRRKGFYKNSKTLEILGGDYETVINHLTNNGEIIWEKGMHVDHIIPIRLAKNEDEVIALNNYKNLRLLTAEQNVAKGGRLPDKIPDGLPNIAIKVYQRNLDQ